MWWRPVRTLVREWKEQEEQGRNHEATLLKKGNRTQATLWRSGVDASRIPCTTSSRMRPRDAEIKAGEGVMFEGRSVNVR